MYPIVACFADSGHFLGRLRSGKPDRTAKGRAQERFVIENAPDRAEPKGQAQGSISSCKVRGFRDGSIGIRFYSTCLR